jgi:hypothetical protein
MSRDVRGLPGPGRAAGRSGASLTYRTHTEADVPALKALWRDADWGEIDDSLWGHRVIQSPFGTTIAVAEDDSTGVIVGQLMFRETRVWVDGRELSSARPGAAILAPAARGMGSLKTVLGLYRLGATVLRQRGVALLHMIPVFSLRPLASGPGAVRTGSIPVWSRGLPLGGPLALPPGFAVHDFRGWDERVDRLWVLWAKLHGCSIVRDSRGLEWKVGNGDLSITAVERDGRLAGLAASERTASSTERFICDVVAEDGDAALQATLAAAVNGLDAEARAGAPTTAVDRVSVLATPVLERALRRLDFFRDTYDFPLVVHVLDPALDLEDVAPGRWYVSAND